MLTLFQNLRFTKYFEKYKVEKNKTGNFGQRIHLFANACEGRKPRFTPYTYWESRPTVINKEGYLENKLTVERFLLVDLYSIIYTMTTVVY